MSRDKQIEEMADILANGCKMGGCEECRYSEGVYPECALKYTAEQLYNAGYRKASDLAEEIFAEINDLRDKYAMGDIEYPDFQFELGKIEKKYTEGEG